MEVLRGIKQFSIFCAPISDRNAMGLFIDCHVFTGSSIVYTLKFCLLKKVSGTVDARKWSAECKNWNIYDIFFSSNSIEGRKLRRRPETFTPCMRRMPSERARQENSFLVLKRIVSTLMTLHIQEDLRCLMKIV